MFAGPLAIQAALQCEDRLDALARYLETPNPVDEEDEE